MKEFRRILVVRTDRIGDVILTLPMVELLRKNFPHAHIALLIRRYTGELVDGHKDVNEIIFYDNGSDLLPFSHLTATLRRGNFDVAFITYPRLRLAGLVWWAGIPLRVGTGYRWYSFFFNKRVYVHRKVAERHEVEYNVDLLRAVGCRIDHIPLPHLEVPQPVKERVRRRLSEFGVMPEKRFAIMHPGSGGSARNWSSKNFGLLGNRLARISDLQIVITGGKGEEELVRSVAETVGENVSTIVDKLTLREYAALAGYAALFVANSTGPLHIAAAVGTPVIGLYPQATPMSAVRWGPLTDRKVVFVPKNKPSDCRICTLKATATSVCECMETITVDDVFEAAKQLLDAKQFSLVE